MSYLSSHTKSNRNCSEHCCAHQQLNQQQYARFLIMRVHNAGQGKNATKTLEQNIFTNFFQAKLSTLFEHHDLVHIQLCFFSLSPEKTRLDDGYDGDDNDDDDEINV